MSLIKLALDHVIVVKQPQDSSSGSSKTFSTRNAIASTSAAVGGFAGQEAVEHLPKFDKLKMSYRFGRRLGTAAGAFLGAATTYKMLKPKKNNQEPEVYML